MEQVDSNRRQEVAETEEYTLMGVTCRQSKTKEDRTKLSFLKQLKTRT